MLAMNQLQDDKEVVAVLKQILGRMYASGIRDEKAEPYDNESEPPLLEAITFAEATKTLTELIANRVVAELEKVRNRMDTNKTDYADTYSYVFDRIEQLSSTTPKGDR